MEWICYVCCKKKRHGSEEILVEPVEIVSHENKSIGSLIDKGISSIYKTSIYKKVSEWSLPKKQPRVNLFGLKASDMSSYKNTDFIPEEYYSSEEENNFADFVDEVIR